MQSEEAPVAAGEELRLPQGPAAPQQLPPGSVATYGVTQIGSCLEN